MTDDVASARAAAEEALALAKAANAAAKQAAGLTETDSAKLLENIRSMTSSAWEMADVLRSIDSPMRTGMQQQKRGVNPDWVTVLNGREQSTQKSHLSSRNAGEDKRPQLSGRTEAVKEVASVPAATEANQAAGRILVQSAKKGKRGPSRRRSTKIAVPAGSNASLDAGKVRASGFPGSMRDLMDTTPGAAGLLTFEEEIELSNGVQVLVPPACHTLTLHC